MAYSKFQMAPIPSLQYTDTFKLFFLKYLPRVSELEFTPKTKVDRHNVNLLFVQNWTSPLNLQKNFKFRVFVSMFRHI
jgi:hypothetical protein